MLFDYTDELQQLADAHNDDVLAMMRGCGCTVSGADAAAGGLGLIGLVGLTVLRRRREDRAPVRAGRR